MTRPHITRVGEGYPLVLFHGWGFDSRIWDAILPMMHRYEVYCVDLPGFGLTPFMDWETFQTQVLQQLPLTFALAGWSLGGMVATRFALEAPRRVSHLLNIASSPCFVADADWPGVPKATLLMFCNRLHHDPETLLNEFRALQSPGDARQLFISATSDGLKAGLDWLLGWDFRPDLHRIQVPVMYCFGRLDAIVPIKTMAVMQASYPHFQYMMISKAAHALFLSHQNLFLQAFEDFIK